MFKEYKYKNAIFSITCDNDDLDEYGYDSFVKYYDQVEEFVTLNKGFAESVRPIEIETEIKIIKEMIDKSFEVGVGPMACVAGVISEFVAKDLVKKGANVVLVNNGGDIYIQTTDEVMVGIYSGNDKFKDQLAVKINNENSPIAICSSSSKMGNSGSYGDCDLVSVFSSSGALADAVATESCNRVKDVKDIEKVLNWAVSFDGVIGVIIVKDGKFGLNGSVPEIVRNMSEDISKKITRDEFFDYL